MWVSTVFSKYYKKPARLDSSFWKHTIPYLNPPRVHQDSRWVSAIVCACVSAGNVVGTVWRACWWCVRLCFFSYVMHVNRRITMWYPTSVLTRMHPIGASSHHCVCIVKKVNEFRSVGVSPRRFMQRSPADMVAPPSSSSRSFPPRVRVCDMCMCKCELMIWPSIWSNLSIIPKWHMST